VVDKRGKAASIMMLGSAMLIFVHMVYAIPTISATWVAVALMLVLGVAFSLVPSAMWPSVAKIFPAHQLGTAYALIFFIQNIGLWGIPVLIGKVLDKFCKVEITDPEQLRALNGCACPSECADCADKCLAAVASYDYTLPMMIFTGLAVSALVIAFILKRVDKSKGYGLELPNIK
jgi:MFS family permease